MNVEHLLQPVTGILSIGDRLGYNVPSNLKEQIANEHYVNLYKFLINNQNPNDDVKLLTSSVALSQCLKSQRRKQ